MYPHGLIGTYFVDPDTINTPTGPSKDDLVVMKMFGWTIGAYSNINMVVTLANDRNSAMARLISMKSTMSGYGIPVESLAPNQRAWSSSLRNICVNILKRVRVASEYIPQAYPPENRLYIKNGGTASLSSTDTAISLNENVTDFLSGSGELWNIVVHKVGDDTDPTYSVSVSAFASLLDRIAAEVLAGTVQVVAMTRFDTIFFCRVYERLLT